MTQTYIHGPSSFLQKTIENRHVQLASGALLGAGIRGSIGFIMGIKVGGLVALTGSVVGALPGNVMRQKNSETNQSQDINMIASNQTML